MDIALFNHHENFKRLCVMTRIMKIRFGGIQESQSLKVIPLLKDNDI